MIVVVVGIFGFQYLKSEDKKEATATTENKTSAKTTENNAGEDVAFAEIIRKIANAPGDELVRIAVADAKVRKRARGQLAKAHVDLSRVDFPHHAHRPGWMRDCGPCFVEKGPVPRHRGYGFDAWSKYPEYALDAQVPSGRQRPGPGNLPGHAQGQPVAMSLPTGLTCPRPVIANLRRAKGNSFIDIYPTDVRGTLTACLKSG